MVSIYKIFFDCDPINIYIGKTEHTLERRLIGHISNSKKGRRLVNIWLRKHINLGNTPKIELICQGENGDELEIKTIQEFRAKGYILHNMTPGGDGIKKGYKHTKQTKESARARSLNSGRWKGKDNPFYGKTGELNHASKKIYQFSLEGEFIKSHGSAGDAAAALFGEENRKKKARPILRAASTFETMYGFQWRNEEYDKIPQKHLRAKLMSLEDINLAKDLLDGGKKMSHVAKQLGVSRSQLKNKLSIPNGEKRLFMSQEDIQKAQILIDEGMSLNQVHKLTGFSQKQIRKKTQAPLFKKYSEIKASILEFNPEFPWEGFIYFLNKKEQEKRQEEK